MSCVLIIESSARQQGSISRQLTQQFINQWQTAHPTDQIIIRDVALNSIPHMDANLIGGWMKPAEQRSEKEQICLERSNELTNELMAADVLVIASPMYNFTIPSTLKAWLDHVIRAGVTFKYTPARPQGLLIGKRAFVLTARGGIHADDSSDHQEPYLRQILLFIGIHDITFIHAEGLNLGSIFREKGIRHATTLLARIV
ncbi:NAD(P)H-dependent oxidoreductase [Pseudomonas fluorescens]|uniref:FMN-dependent NADH-azoreductase n=1 Tax=Pseudomonas TaxID=286 RepID=UPI000DD3758E|nr:MULTISPECIES: NAD(P)H-dependent oxidoreductase [Pseudomonas]MBD8254110.1 NAD(P)H-dependent oxidoreductase [Pseudomonas fluorescens]MBH3398089.1 NAD(P)H-dependent oxidoreductase [Pseudomonas fluorescens]MCF5172118.1 ACP phosphodiesterase [Pseudomonas canadensis]MDV3056554.1 NAD(P)H-dependent oxidoreductase [Pseudomonas paracarnis]TKK04446.1 ACP phosphodiesterase [Pseudomonas fluorescens]